MKLFLPSIKFKREVKKKKNTLDLIFKNLNERTKILSIKIFELICLALGNRGGGVNYKNLEVLYLHPTVWITTVELDLPNRDLSISTTPLNVRWRKSV